MKKRTMKVLSLIVAIVMAISILPLAALAEEVEEQTGETRQVGVVVYGAELTAVLTDMEKTIQGNGKLEDSLATLTDIATKVADGTGISVPDVTVSLTDENGKKYKMSVPEKPVDIFMDTTDMYVGFQEEVDRQLTKLETDLQGLREALRESGGLSSKLAGQIDKLEEALNKIRTETGKLKDTMVGAAGELTKLNGTLYRVYVTEEPVLANKDYTVYVEGFTDADEDGNAITRDGYILYNDGLGEEGSKINTKRTFPITVKEKGRFDKDVQYVGPGFGLEGDLELPKAFTDAYDGFTGALNTILKTATDMKNAAANNGLVSFFSDLIADVTNTQPVLDWFNAWTAPKFSSSDEIPNDYHFKFPGLWCDELDAGFTFRNVDVAENPVEGSKFLLVNRQELIDVLKLMKDLGKDAFEGALKATFGGEMTYADGTVKDYDSIVNLYTQLIQTEEGQLSLDYDTAYAIVKTYLGVIMDMHLINRVVDFPEGLGLPKLKYPIPAILQAESDADGLVAFKKSSNMTLTWIIDLIPEITKIAGQLVADGENNNMVAVMELLQDFIEKSSDVVADAVNILVYPFAQRLGLVGPKLASGEYIMFQTGAPEDYWVNPIAYTMDITWHSEGTANEDWYYSTVADMGLLTPYFAEGFYDFVRKTSFAGTLDSILGQISGKEDFNVISEILNGKIDVTVETQKIAMAALTGFVAQLGYESLGADVLFPSKSDFLSDLNKYLIQNGQTAQNLVVYLNRTAMRAKTVYTGRVDDGWYFYNLDKSPTLTATKLIQKSTDDLVKATAVEVRKPIIQKAGDAVKNVVGNIGFSIEKTVNNIRQRIAETIGNTIKNSISNAFNSLKDSVVDFFTGFFNRNATA